MSDPHKRPDPEDDADRPHQPSGPTAGAPESTTGPVGDPGQRPNPSLLHPTAATPLDTAIRAMVEQREQADELRRQLDLVSGKSMSEALKFFQGGGSLSSVPGWSAIASVGESVADRYSQELADVDTQLAIEEADAIREGRQEDAVLKQREREANDLARLALEATQAIKSSLDAAIAASAASARSLRDQTRWLIGLTVVIAVATIISVIVTLSNSSPAPSVVRAGTVTVVTQQVTATRTVQVTQTQTSPGGTASLPRPGP